MFLACHCKVPKQPRTERGTPAGFDSTYDIYFGALLFQAKPVLEEESVCLHWRHIYTLTIFWAQPFHAQHICAASIPTGYYTLYRARKHAKEPARPATSYGNSGRVQHERLVYTGYSLDFGKTTHQKGPARIIRISGISTYVYCSLKNADVETHQHFRK